MLKPKHQYKYRWLSIVMMTGFFISPVISADLMKKSQSYANFNAQGELIRPTGYREWVYVGTPLTPNDMNNGKAAFPEFHNVYIDPLSWEHWKRKGSFS